MVRVVTVFPSATDEEARMALAAQVLDTLRIEPLDAATTTIAPTVTAPDAHRAGDFTLDRRAPVGTEHSATSSRSTTCSWRGCTTTLTMTRGHRRGR